MKIKFLIVLSLLPALLVAQIQTPFRQRTSIFSPEKKIYRVQGDYTMIGNTNLTLSSTSLNGDNNNDTPNSNNTLKYVDVDNDANTFNSSTAALTFSQEYGANPNCTEVVYAGLYWTGRTNDNNLNTNITEDIFIGDGQALGGLTCNVEKIAGNWTSSSGTPTFLYTLITESSDTLRITVQKSDNNHYHVTDGSTGITQSDCAGTNYTGTIGTGNRNYAFVHLNTPIEWENYVIDIIRFYSADEATMRAYSGVQCTKNLGDYPKNKIKIKHANANEYRTIEASPNDIYMDQMGDFIYVSYAEVTEYVQQYGLGNYTVADLVTNKGNGGSLGYLGCWGMVVVYENSNMKWRDITLFDGYASLHQDFYELEIPIEGFRTVQVGRVNMKLGMMAAEGDRNMAGDSCFIQKQSDHSWFPLIHDGADSLSNFFNSSIQTGGNYRYPNYVNNTGIDIIVMDVPNDNNQIITNEQTSTAFKFTTRPRYVEAGDHEQYHPFCFVMGVDAYVPDAEAISGVMHLDTTVFWDDEAGYYTIPPGSIVEFEVSVKNFGTEDILDAKLEIPLPNTIEYYDTEVLYTYPGVTADFYFDAERNANGTAGWNINYLWSGDPNQVYVKVKLICKVTEDCYVLASTDEDCLLALHVNGTLEGTSYVNNVYFKKGSFISGFRDGECAGDAIRNDILVVVDKEGWIAENCDVNIDYNHREINICGNIFMDEDPATIDAIPFMKIYDLYPQGSRFFHSETNEEYTMETGFPIPELFGEVILVQSSSIYSAECSSELMLNNFIDNDGFIDEENLINTSSVTYCLGEDAPPLSELITIENPDKYYVRFYRDNSGSAPAELDIIPNTNELGTVTYYVRQFLKNTIGCEDNQYYPITITVVSPITLSADQPLPTCYGEEVNITATPAGGTFSYSEELEDHIEVNGNVLTIKTTMPAGSVFITYTHNNIVDNTTGCEISQLTYEHQIAQPTIPGLLSQDGTICEGSQIFPLEITEHSGHIERWEWTTTYPQAETTVWNIIPNNTTIITSEDLGNLSAGNYYFRALIKDGNCAPDWTNTIHIEVLSAPAPDPLTFVSPQYACIGTEYEIQVPDETVTYHWYSNPIGGWPDDDLRNVTVTNSWVTRYVSVVSSNENECESIRSEIVVRPNVDPGIISSAGQFVCEIGSDPVTIGSQPTDDRDGQAHVFPSGTVEYQWYVTTTNENGTTSTELISGATSETFTPTDYMSQEGVFIFTRKVRAEGCDDWQQSDGSWRLSIGNPDATISTSPTSILPCNPSVETPITLTAVGPGTKYSYKWYYNDVEITGSVSQTIQVANPGEYKVQVTHKNSGCVATTTIPISIVIDTQGPNVENGETIIPCSKEDAHNVTIYETVEEIEAGLGISIMDNIVDDNLLTLALTDSIVTANPTDVCYKIERIYTVTDDCNNSDTLTHTIKVIDTEKPVITTTAESGDKGCNPTIVAPTFTGSDNCAGDISASIEVVTTGIVEEGCKRTQTWTANYTDACGNVADEVRVTYTWTVDTEKPVIATTAENNTDLGCNPDIIVAPTFTGSDNCAGDISSENIIVTTAGPSNIGCSYTQTWTANYTDACGNAATPVRITYTWTEDNEKPVISTTAENNTDLGCNPDIIVAPTFTGSDNCAGDISSENIIVTTAGPSNIGCSYTQTWTANYTDACGNVADEVTVTYTWTVDTEKPVITTTAESGDKGCNPTNIVAPTFTGSDNCAGDISANISVVTDGPSNTGCVYTQTWTANYTDACGNVADEVRVTYTWTVDTEKPVIATTAENNTDLGCNPDIIVAPTFTGSDNCAGDISSENIIVTTAGPSNIGCSYTQTWTANYTDACGNVADEVTVTYTWTIDTGKPVIATTAENNKDWGCNPTNIVAPTFTGTDNCAGDISASIEVVTTGIVEEGCKRTQTWTANYTDACDNAATPVSVTYTWTVDTERPVITTTAVSGDKGCNPTIVAPTFTVTDNCTETINSDITVTKGEVIVDGCKRTQTWTANYTDACGNVADEVSVTYTWTVDTERPVITTTAVSGDKGCNPTIDAPTFTGTDNCAGDISASIEVVTTGIVVDGCKRTQTWTANYTDACGNVADEVTVTYTWTVDTERPVITTTAESGDKGCNPTIVAPTFTGTDNCAGNISSENIIVTTAGPSNIGCSYTQTWTANYTDACGNAADEVTVTYTWIEDMEAPMLNDVWPTLTAQNSCFANRDTTGLYSNEAVKALYTDCTEITVSSSNTTIGSNCGWTVTRTYTITDACGNSVTNTMSVSGSDQTAPVIESINLNRTLTSTNCVFTIPDMREDVRNISSDCSEITVTQPSAGMEVYPMVAERDTTVNVIVTDICGNSSVKEVIITIPAKVTISAMATPAVICNGETSQLSATAANVVGTAVYAWTPATELSSATIANPTVTLTASGAAATTTYTVHVTDDNGCTATATASVTVNPEVVMNSVADWTLCVGETSPEYIFESEITDGAITYGWHNNTPAIGLAAMGEGNLPSFVAANATPANLIAEVKAAPTYTNNGISCQGDSVTFYITVRPSILTPGNVEFSCPRDTTVMLAYNECEQFVNIGYPEFVNNMTDMDVVITNDAPTDFIFTEGTTIVIWTATDECGATLECHQNITVVFPPCGTPNDSVADFDGYRYSSVRIGCQCWTGENARSEHYSDGTPVDNFRYYNDSDSLENIYGKLYTWYAAMGVPEGDNNAEPSITTDPLGRPYVQGICPEGWALPTIEEYMLMIANSGDATHAKDGSNLYWLPGNEGQPPFSGFDAYGAGTYNGALNRYEGLLGTTYFWTTLNVPGAETTTTVEINYYCAEGLQTELNKGDGASIRCLRKE